MHLDGYNLIPALKGEGEWPRKEFLYWTDDGSVAPLRYSNWKITFLRQNEHGLHVWTHPFEELRAPLLCNLRMDPFERAEYEGMDYDHWFIDHMFIFAPAGGYVAQWLQTFREFPPPRQKPGSFNLDPSDGSDHQRPAKGKQLTPHRRKREHEDDRPYYVRQMKNMKASMPVAFMTGEPFDFWAFVCGMLLARAQARTGDAARRRTATRPSATTPSWCRRSSAPACSPQAEAPAVVRGGRRRWGTSWSSREGWPGRERDARHRYLDEGSEGPW